ncbi:MAG: preprotein translocase subunit SecE [Ignavibacteriales bacterium]
MKTRAARAKAAAATPAPAASSAPAAPKKRTDPVKFWNEVRAEARKITWTSRQETWITSVMVFIMVALAGLFFFGADSALGWLVAQVLKFANAG